MSPNLIMETTALTKSYGTVMLKEGQWHIQAEPHVMIRLKAVLGRVNKNAFGTVTIADSPEVCCDLEWFAQRYPLEVQNLDVLKLGATRYRSTMADLEKISLPSYIATRFALEKPLRPYQCQAVDMYLKRGNLLLADQVGLGKSACAIGAMTDKTKLPCLVVVKTHLAEQWEQYVYDFLPFSVVHIISKSKPYDLPEADVYIITYHKLSGWADVLPKVVKSVVYDEIQELRHPESGKYAAAKHLRDHVPATIGLSATPIFNYGGEIFNILEIVCPGEIGTREEFEREWCDGYGRHVLLKDPNAFGAYLRDHYIMLRRERKDVGRELPAKQTVIQTVEYEHEALAAIDDLATELAHRILKGSFHDSGEAAMEFDMKLRQATGISKAPYVAAFVKMLVEDGHSVLLTGWHRDVYDVWKEHLKPLEIVMFTGSESPKQKREAKQKFLDKQAQVFIMSLRSGDGLDGLQGVCSTIVHGELDWSPAVHEQCDGRLERDGQAESVMSYYMVSEGGSDPLISEVLGLKKSQASGLLDREPGGLKKLQTDGGARVKRMAEQYLKRKGK